MHMPNCNCPRCRAAAQDFEFETSGIAEAGRILDEQEEMELAMELLQVQSDQELDQFLGNMFRSVGRGLKAVGSFAVKKVAPVLGPALKQIAKAALPIAGGALGSLIPIPGVGTALGSALGGAVANALEMEVAGLDPETAEIERARRFVRLAASAIQQAAGALGTTSPENAARAALAEATRRHSAGGGRRGDGRDARPDAARPAGRPPPGPVAPGQSGLWRRQGNLIVVDGL